MRPPTTLPNRFSQEPEPANRASTEPGAKHRRFGELDCDDATAAALGAISPATIDRRLASDRARMFRKGRSHTKPGALLKDAIPIRTWAQWDDVVPGFVEIDPVRHEGGDALGDHAYTLTVTDIATGWRRTARSPARPARGSSGNCCC